VFHQRIPTLTHKHNHLAHSRYFRHYEGNKISEPGLEQMLEPGLVQEQVLELVLEQVLAVLGNLLQSVLC